MRGPRWPDCPPALLCRPYHEILEEAGEIKADLIVMASHRPGFATYLMGSNATYVVRHARCSVLVIRPGD